MNRSLKFTAHASTMMHERMIQEDWIVRTVTSPDNTEERSDEEIHYLQTDPGSRRKNTPGDHQPAEGSSSRDYRIL